MNSVIKTTKLGLGSFNFIKGVAIAVIIIGHLAVEFDTLQLTWFFPLFSVLSLMKTTLIPLFFVISGYGLVAGRIRTTLKKTFKSLLFPYFFVMAVFCVSLPVLTLIRTQDVPQALGIGLSVFLAFLLGVPIPGKVLFGITLSHCAIVWFLLAMFWAHNLTHLILRRKKTAEQILLILGCAALGYVLFLLDFTYFCLPHGLIAASYFYIGYLLKKYRLLEKKLPHKWMYAVWFTASGAYACFGHFDLCYGDFRFFPMDYLGVMLLTLLILVAGIHIGTLEWRCLDFLHYIGACSYWVLCIHSVEQKCLPWGYFIRLTQDYPNLGFLAALLIKAIIISVFCAVMKRAKKRKYRKQKIYYEQKLLHAEFDRAIPRR